MPTEKKSVKFQKEQIELISNLYNLLPLDNTNSFILYTLEQNTECQRQIIDLVPNIKKYFNINNIHGVKNTEKSKRPWICIIRSILKQSYDIFITECSIKINEKTIRTRKYTFIQKDIREKS